ncbi:hypothetical protein B0A49_10417 [Cryomyces minteri]|uniref:non-specific serine/threonine protein kinase n=2 Tax=Cryomyces minteri TaxID=331657 RepID=A0A4U0WJZ3_9PEZI|nr:hypothetical protein B0A49_10417 [Cryomyces minteri]
MGMGTHRPRFSFDEGVTKEYDQIARSPVIAEHEHGLGASGLRRIRQQPPLRQTTGPDGNTGSATRQNILKRSIDFMRDKLGWAACSPGIANAQAKLSGDQEVQSMMELLARANLIGQDALQAHGLGYNRGPLTGPADVAGENIFEKSFLPRSESPRSVEELEPPVNEKKDAAAILDHDHISQEMEPADHAEPKILHLTLTKTLSNESTSPSQLSLPLNRRVSLKRTYTDTAPLTIQSKLTDALAQPYLASDTMFKSHLVSPKTTPAVAPASATATATVPPVEAPHLHGTRFAPAAQAIFTTEAHAPWTITAANDLACLVFGVTKAEVRKMGILEVVREERRKWLEDKLRCPELGTPPKNRLPYSKSQRSSPSTTTSLAMGNGVTAKLLSKPSSRQAAQSRRAQTDDGSGSSYINEKTVKGSKHAANKSRGVLLCGDVVPIQKRNGAVGSASLWVKEKRGGLIWVLEEIAEDIVYLIVDEVGCVTKATGATEAVWGMERVRRGMDIKKLVPAIPKKTKTNTGALDYDVIADVRRYTARTSNSINIPITIDRLSGEPTFRVSSFPHVAGIIVLSANSLKVTSSNTAFTGALFGQQNPDGLHVTELIPAFDKMLDLMTEEDNIRLVDGLVIPEHTFRRARALLALREGKADAAAVFLRPSGLPAKHRDGAEIMVDVQMRVVTSDRTQPTYDETVIEEASDDEGVSAASVKPLMSEVVYALWITYSRQMHAANHGTGPVTPLVSRPGTPPHQPSPGQSISSTFSDSVESRDGPLASSFLAQKTEKATSQPIALATDAEPIEYPATSTLDGQKNVNKKSINDFVILEEMGQGAYGQVKLARYKKNSSKKMVIKYVTKRRILVDTWTRDRKLGTVPLEIHVLDYLRRDGLTHSNIVEMADFFEDDINYYIEMVPHGLPGMDLFDYIELRVNMEENEARKIFVQVASALHHLHTKAKVVHRDIKDENVILDGEGNIKVIDFGSAAYIKSGPFDVFVGTIDYAAPEVLAGRPYRGKEQDVWALGILLYTIVYKENPFYSIDEIMDHDLRVPYIMSEESIDLIRLMLNRDVEQRATISQVLEHPWCTFVPEDN